LHLPPFDKTISITLTTTCAFTTALFIVIA
jgi:hypothetical protein